MNLDKGVEKRFDERFVSIYGEDDGKGNTLERKMFVEEDPSEIKQFFATEIANAKKEVADSLIEASYEAINIKDPETKHGYLVRVANDIINQSEEGK